MKPVSGSVDQDFCLPAVLVIENDAELAALIQSVLAPYASVQCCSTRREAEAFLRTARFSGVIVEDELPDQTGYNWILPFFLDRIALRGLLISKGSIRPALIDRRFDWLEKPLTRALLEQALQRLLSQESVEEEAGLPEIAVNPKTEDVFCGGVRVELTPHEYKLLMTLLECPKRVHSRDMLRDQVQGPGVAVVDRVIDAHVFSLRKKLGVAGNRIRTIRGEGYSYE